ncbi:Ger(x)C family spore germination protein [Fictibacillus sp. KIGAM418]|uniref:Ger(X)C family spore germination protein n=1 Tax=Fictibacillus marinisediminis TaxID=2878389 RepID=A0A9X1X9D9_9BACL|nr:Ger(x)C family spore germination protein [Fictibacillus marinisediminis]MCK6256399.1 Ger(x)C family spore germination protein [Fictibacillus marinisediminis]
MNGLQKKMIVFLGLVLILTGCWDQKQLKDTIFAASSSFEEGKKGEIITNIAIQSYTAKEIQSINKTYKTQAASPRNARVKLNDQLSSVLMYAKNQTFLVQNKLASKGILPLLDILYRTPESPLNAKYIIVKGSPGTILSLEQVGQELIGSYLAGLIDTAETNSQVPKETIQSMCTILFDKGKGLGLPYVKLNETNKTASVLGIALFHRDKFSGVTLNRKESKLLLLLANRKNKHMINSDKVKVDGKKENISYEVNKSDAELEISKGSAGHLVVNIPMTIDITINEFPHDHLDSKKEITLLEDHLGKMLQHQAYSVMKKTQKANCDFLGIGRELMAYHPEIWKKQNWDKDYRKITFKPKVKVSLNYKGIIN